MLFRCVRSGRTMEITDPDNIVQMRNNESYVEVSAYSQGEQNGLRKETEEVPVQNADAAPKVKRLGRPRKNTELVI